MFRTAHLYAAVAGMTLACTAVYAAPAMARAQQMPDEQAITRSLNQAALQHARITLPAAENIHALRSNVQSTDQASTDSQNPDSATNAEDDASGSSIDNSGTSSELPPMVPDGQPIPLTPDEPGSPGDNPNTP